MLSQQTQEAQSQEAGAQQGVGVTLGGGGDGGSISALATPLCSGGVPSCAVLSSCPLAGGGHALGGGEGGAMRAWHDANTHSSSALGNGSCETRGQGCVCVRGGGGYGVFVGGWVWNSACVCVFNPTLTHTHYIYIW
jgi:hypothetical protein